MVSILWLLSIPLLIILLIFVFLGVMIIDWVFIKRTRFIKKGIIKSINGIKDNDTGFSSSGSTEQTTLLFKDGEVMTFNQTIPFITLNKKCVLTYEVTKWFKSIDFKDISYNDANQGENDE